jgi:quinoprotein glucose dehydrogenase
MRREWQSLPATAIVVLVLAWTTTALWGQADTKNGEWPTWGGDLRSTRYSPLDQINAGNFNKLEVAWRFKTDVLGPRREFYLEGTPLMVKGVVYATAGTRKDVVALNAVTGELLWVHREDEGARAEAAPRQLSGRGLAYWTDGTEERILYVTIGYRLVALDAKSGIPVPSFGQKGLVDLKLEDDQQMDLITGEIGLHATPIVAQDVVIVGAAHREGSVPKSKRNEKGFVRGYDVRTGKRLWIFHTIALPGEFGNDTWENDSWSYTGNTGVWTQISVDEDLGLVYLPVESPTGDYYGGHRPGNNLFGESLVCVDLKTGQRKWHYQLVHHPIWDRDISSAPILADIVVNGRTIKAVAQPTKQAWLYVFDRVSGKPVWPIEERPVPQSDVPGEKTSPTQPFPTKPPAYDRQGLSIADLIDFTPELRAEAVKLVSQYKIGPIFTPPVVSKVEGPLALLMEPAFVGGTNWFGGSYDPETHILYTFSQTLVTSVGLLRADPKQSDMNYIRGIASPVSGAAGAASPAPSDLTVQGLPLVKPPWGRITAIDLNKGDILWQVPHGETPDNVRNHPALKGLTIPRTGRPGNIGTLVTKTLLIAGEGGFVTTPSGERGAMLRAYDKLTGKEVGAVYMPAPATGLPMTYMMAGRQYVVVAVSGAGYSAEYIAFRLPS